MKNRMYENTTTWNPFKGCLFDCTYCGPSFKRQAKRQKKNCIDCYNYVPHYHPDRLKKIPSAETIFVCGNSDLSFCKPDFMREIIGSIKKHNQRRPDKTYFFQSKRPECFEPIVDELPDNAIILTTLETNRDEGYEAISKAPAPSRRYAQLKALNYSRKVVTIEPVMDFDLDVFVGWLASLKPEYIFIGLNSHPEQVELPEPDRSKLIASIQQLKMNDIAIKFKGVRGIHNGTASRPTRLGHTPGATGYRRPRIKGHRDPGETIC